MDLQKKHWRRRNCTDYGSVLFNASFEFKFPRLYSDASQTQQYFGAYLLAHPLVPHVGNLSSPQGSHLSGTRISYQIPPFPTIPPNIKKQVRPTFLFLQTLHPLRPITLTLQRLPIFNPILFDYLPGFLHSFLRKYHTLFFNKSPNKKT